MSIQLQSDLVELGYGEIVGKIDGIIGKKTKDAVEQFQRERVGLAVDGIAGVKTMKSIREWQAQAGVIGTRNFKIKEFASPDNGSLPKKGMDNELLLKLELLRWTLGNKTIVINSGYRTPAFNKKIGGYAYSNHLKGKAADIKVVGVSAKEVQKVAARIFEGLGTYRNFTHVDVEKPAVQYAGKY